MTEIVLRPGDGVRVQTGGYPVTLRYGEDGALEIRVDDSQTSQDAAALRDINARVQDGDGLTLEQREASVDQVFTGGAE